jgi:predicted RNase H-like HicB family nuclease
MIPMFDEVLTGASTPEEALQKASDAMDKVLSSE